MHGTLTVVLLLLLIAAAVGFLAKRIRIHYNVTLVLAGVVLGATQAVPRVGLQPEIVLQVFLPILLYEATLATDLRRLRENLVPVAVLAVPGMLTTVFVAGAILHAGLRLEWPVALLLGSALAATDTIAVIASFRKVRVSPRLAAIVENESLLNDGTAIVAFTTILAAIEHGRFDLASGLTGLAWVTAVGLGCGLVLGYAIAQLLRRTEDYLMEIMLTAVQAGKQVVRLQSGDLSLYSAIQEQMALLDEAGIDYEAVPGISAFQAAAAALHSELTIPEVVQTIILTRGEGKTKMPAGESLAALAAHRASLCIFLSARLSRTIQEQLLTAYAPETPVAILYRVSWPDEKIIVTRLQDLHSEIRKHKLTRTTLILVGEAIGSRKNRSRLYHTAHAHIFRRRDRVRKSPPA